MKKNRICFNCLSSTTHDSRTCPVNYSSNICSRHHNVLLHFHKEKTNSPASSPLNEGGNESTTITLIPSQHSLNPEANDFESSTNRDNFVRACKNELQLRKKTILSIATIYVQNISKYLAN